MADHMGNYDHYSHAAYGTGKRIVEHLKERTGLAAASHSSNGAASPAPPASYHAPPADDITAQLPEVIVTVPDGAQAGTLIQFRGPDGTMMQVPVPPGAAPGHDFKVQLSKFQDGQIVTLRVPKGADANQRLVSFTAPDGTSMMVTIPDGKLPGDEFQVMLAPPATSLKFVGHGVRGGEGLQFTLPDGSEMRATVPDGLQHGATFAVALSRQPTLANGHAASDINESGLGRLCSFVSAGQLEAVKHCIAEGIPVNGVYQDGFTAIFYAAMDGQVEVMEWLLRHGADLTARNHQSRTALHWAARNGHMEVVKLLLAARADASVEDNTQRTPAALAAEKGNILVAQLLQDVQVAQYREAAAKPGLY